MNLDDGALALALAILIGVVAQAVGRHARVPGIVLLLLAGIGLGPDGANLIRPSAMGTGLSALVGFAVAVILFEGGLGLQIPVLRAQAKPIRRLVTIGALITAVFGALTCKLLMQWDWQLSILFGTLVIVTGPTVVTPLVRRLRLSEKLTSILIAEGIFIDAIGATIAVVALEIALAPTRSDAAAGALSIVLRFGVGAVIGVAGGMFLVLLLRTRRLVPHGLENILALAVALVAFHLSSAIVGESGITAAIVAGIVVGNGRIRLRERIIDFSEQLTVLFVAALFVLLSADVRLDDVASLGWRGALVVAVLMLVVRPMTVFASTVRTELSFREKLYLSWIAPRGIVAAAVASLFAIELAHHGVEGGVEMRALVFVVIATTVTVQGLSASVVGRLLGVRQPERLGFLVLGGHALSRLLCRVLMDAGQRVTMIERADDVCIAARREGFHVVQGDGLDPKILETAGVHSVAHVVGMTTNEHVNYLFLQMVGEDYRGPELYVVLERADAGVTPAMARRHDMHLLFASEHDLLLWLDRARRGWLLVQKWKLDGQEDTAFAEVPDEYILPLAIVGTRVALITTGTQVRSGDVMAVAISASREADATAWLSARGWSRCP
ncbi:MAG: cation:proton antiporter [Kofleriaceae bacterium]